MSADVLQARAAALAAVEVDHFHAAAVGAEEDVVAIQRQVLRRVAGRQDVTRRGFFQCGLDQATRGLDDRGLPIDGGAVGMPRCPGRVWEGKRTPTLSMTSSVAGGFADFLRA